MEAIVPKAFFTVHERARDMERKGLFEGARSQTFLQLGARLFG